MDILAFATMKNAANCDKSCELQNSVNHQSFERMLRCWGTTTRKHPFSMPVWARSFCFHFYFHFHNHSQTHTHKVKREWMIGSCQRQTHTHTSKSLWQRVKETKWVSEWKSSSPQNESHTLIHTTHNTLSHTQHTHTPITHTQQTHPDPTQGWRAFVVGVVFRLGVCGCWLGCKGCWGKLKFVLLNQCVVVSAPGFMLVGLERRVWGMKQGCYHSSLSNTLSLTHTPTDTHTHTDHTHTHQRQHVDTLITHTNHTHTHTQPEHTHCDTQHRVRVRVVCVCGWRVVGVGGVNEPTRVRVG